MQTEEIIYEYEQLLMGKKKSIDSDVFCYQGYGNEVLALSVFRYAIEKVLGWSPNDAYHYLNAEVIQLLKLKMFIRYIEYPPEFDPQKDFFYIVVKLYPTVFKISAKERTLSVYQRLLNKEISKLPKRFIEGRDGEMRALFCLRYAINNYGHFKNIEDLYRAFAGSEGRAFLREVRLTQVCNTLFELPIDYLHESFAPEDQDANSFLYSYWRFRAYVQKLKLAEKTKMTVLKRKQEKKEVTEIPII